MSSDNLPGLLAIPGLAVLAVGIHSVVVLSKGKWVERRRWYEIALCILLSLGLGCFLVAARYSVNAEVDFVGFPFVSAIVRDTTPGPTVDFSFLVPLEIAANFAIGVTFPFLVLRMVSKLFIKKATP